MPDILCPTEFSAPAINAFRHAIDIATRFGCGIEVVHVLSGANRKGDGPDRVRKLMNDQLALAPQGMARGRFSEGDVFEDVAAASMAGHGLMVLGTHGPRGLRQNLFGADVLKLVRMVHTPTIVVQEHSPLGNRFERIVMPVAGHKDLNGMLNAVCMLARTYASEVHVYQLMRPGETPSEQLLENKRRMLYRLSEEGIRHLEVNEPSNMFSMGFAKQTVDYAKRIKAGCIAIMAQASDEYRYIADAEKEHMLTNEAFIPVLCAN